jgi:mannitol PTS system EIICBA or EIICB component
MKPVLIVGVILGGMTGIATNQVMGTGLRAPAAPGSIFAVLAQTPRGNYIGVILSVILSAAVTFFICAVILRASRKTDLAAAGESDALAAAIARTEANKGKKSALLEGLEAGSATAVAPAPVATAVLTRPITSIVFACDAGMGSSVMGASVLKSKLKKAGIEGVSVVNMAVANLTDDADIVISQIQLTDRARRNAPTSVHMSVDNFMNSPVYDTVVQEVLASREQPGGVSV